MKKEEAIKILECKLNEYRNLSYFELVKKLENRKLLKVKVEMAKLTKLKLSFSLMDVKKLI